MRRYFILFLLLIFTDCYAQQDKDSIPVINNSLAKSKETSNHHNLKRDNLFKINLYSLFVKNYSFSYERLIARRVSVQIGYRFQPYNYLMENSLGRQLNKRGAAIDFKYYYFQTSNNAITGDIRLYTGKKDRAQGLYVGIYGRYAHFDADNMDYNYITTNEREFSVPLISNFNGIGGGIILGMQWIIKKRISLEYYILGGHYGKINGSLVSSKDLSGLSEQEKNELKENIKELFFISNRDYLSELTVNDDGVNGKIAGPFWGVRTGISIGVVF